MSSSNFQMRAIEENLRIMLVKWLVSTGSSLVAEFTRMIVTCETYSNNPNFLDTFLARLILNVKYTLDIRICEDMPSHLGDKV